MRGEEVDRSLKSDDDPIRPEDIDALLPNLPLFEDSGRPFVKNGWAVNVFATVTGKGF
jgi:hypothetical protein